MIFRFSPAGFLWNHSLPIYDNTGHVRYRLYADGYRLTRPVYLRDLGGRDAAVLLRQSPSLFPRYDMEVYGRPVGTLERILRDKVPEYRLTGLGWQITGSVKEGNFSFRKHESPVAFCQRDGNDIILTCEEDIYALSALGAAAVLCCILGPSEPPAKD